MVNNPISDDNHCPVCGSLVPHEDGHCEQEVYDKIDQENERKKNND